MNRDLKSALMLFLTAAIWGMAFVAQTQGMEHLGPFTFTTSRSFIGSMFLLIVFVLSKKNILKFIDLGEYSFRDSIRGGLLCGVLLFIAINLQQYSLKFTTAGKAGFITTLYIVMVPIIGLFFKHRLDLKTALCVVFAVIGMYFLCVNDNLSINFGDVLVFISAIFFAFHIITISIFIKTANGILMSSLQLFVVAVLSFVVVIFKESFTAKDLLNSLYPILYVGILSSGVAYTLQIFGLKNLNPTVASLITSLESVFASVFGFLILNQSMYRREIIGALIMFMATIFAQIPVKKRYSDV